MGLFPDTRRAAGVVSPKDKESSGLRLKGTNVPAFVETHGSVSPQTDLKVKDRSSIKTSNNEVICVTRVDNGII